MKKSMPCSLLMMFYIPLHIYASAPTISTQVTIPARDTIEGIAYEVLFEQKLPLIDRSIDPSNVEETVGTMLMFNLLDEYYQAYEKTLLNETPARQKVSYGQRIDFIKDNMTKELENSIKKRINHIIDILKNRQRAFETKGEKGFFGKQIDKARGWFARKWSSDNKALDDYKDHVFWQINPADTRTGNQPVGIRNRITYLYQELFEIVHTARQVGDLLSLYIYLGNQNNAQLFQVLIENIETSKQSLWHALHIYIKHLEDSNEFATKPVLQFFATTYQKDLFQIIDLVKNYLLTISKRSKQNRHTPTSNRNDLYVALTLPSTFDLRTEGNIAQLRETVQKQKSEISLLKAKNEDLVTKLINIETKHSTILPLNPLKRAIRPGSKTDDDIPKRKKEIMVIPEEESPPSLQKRKRSASTESLFKSHSTTRQNPLVISIEPTFSIEKQKIDEEATGEEKVFLEGLDQQIKNLIENTKNNKDNGDRATDNHSTLTRSLIKNINEQYLASDTEQYTQSFIDNYNRKITEINTILNNYEYNSGSTPFKGIRLNSTSVSQTTMRKSSQDARNYQQIVQNVDEAITTLTQLTKEKTYQGDADTTDISSITVRTLVDILNKTHIPALLKSGNYSVYNEKVGIIQNLLSAYTYNSQSAQFEGIIATRNDDVREEKTVVGEE